MGADNSATSASSGGAPVGCPCAEAGIEPSPATLGGHPTTAGSVSSAPRDIPGGSSRPGTGLALSLGLGLAVCCRAVHTGATEDPGVRLLCSGCPTSAKLRWPCENAPRGNQGRLPVFPWLRSDREQCQEPKALYACVTGDTAQHARGSTVLAEEHLVAPLPAGVLQPHLSSRLPRTPAQKWVWGLLLQQCGSRSGPQWAVTTTEQRGGPAPHPAQALVTTTPFQGIMTNIDRGKSSRHLY